MAKTAKNSLPPFSLPAQARVKSKKLSDAIFQHTTSSFLVHPVLVRYLLLPPPTLGFPVQMMVIVSKKRFKKAVDRNRVKRLLREAYRLNKPTWSSDYQLIVGFQFIGKSLPTLASLSGVMQKINSQIAQIQVHKVD